MSEFVVHRCRLFEYSPCAIHCITASPVSHDLAVARSDGTIEIWNTDESWFIKLVIPGIKDHSVECLAWVGKRLLSGGLHGEITEYDLSSASIKTSVDSFGTAVWCMVPSTNEDKLAVGCEDGSVKMFDVQNKSISFEKSFDKQEGRILSMAWHEDGGIIVTGSVDVIRVWSTKTGRAIQRVTIDRHMKNVEVIVWSVVILKDLTIVSGDSAGRLQFWDSKTATQYKSFHIHRADVLCVCPHPDGRSVFAAGVDPRVFQFNLTHDGDPSSWVKGRALQRHTHDIRTLAIVRNQIVSGGVDTNILTNSLDGKAASKFQRVYSFPSKSLVSVSPKLGVALFQYPEHLELWSLAKTSSTGEVESNDCVQIQEHPVKLLELKKNKSDRSQIISSCISKCGKWLTYSTASNLRIYQINVDLPSLKVEIQRVRCVGLAPAHTVIFTPDSRHMIISGTNHKTLIVQLDSETYEARLVHMFPAKSYTSITHLLCVSKCSKYLATANLDSEICVYDITNMTQLCSAPRSVQIPTAIAFSPNSKSLWIAYDNLQVFEFCLTKFCYTDWTKKAHLSKKQPILKTLAPPSNRHGNTAVVINIMFKQTEDKEEIFFVSRSGIYVIERLPEGTLNEPRGRFCHKFRPIMFCDVTDDNTMLVVERPLQEIWSQLPPTLYQKKFGT